MELVIQRAMKAPAVCLLALACLASLGSGCRRKPSDAELFTRGSALFNEAHYPEAIMQFRMALQANPKRGDIRLKLGDAYLRVKDGKNALAEYRRAADLLPNSVEAQLKAGNLLLLAQSYEDAKTLADRAITLDAKNVDAQVLRGNALAGLKNLDGAMTDYQEAIAIDPAQVSAYQNLAALQLVRGQRDQAEDTFRKAVALAPGSIDARLALANFLWSTNRPADAEAALREAVKMDRKSLAANRALGFLLLISGRAADAEPYFSAIARDSNTPGASLTLADYYMSVRRYDDARRILREVADHDEAYAAATLRLASLDSIQGDRAQALSRLHEVLVKLPKEPSAHLLTARLLLVDGKRDEALAHVTSVITSDVSPAIAAQAYQLAGQIYSMSDRTDEALAAYEEVLKRGGRPLAAELALARLHLSRGHADKAAGYATQALGIQPRNPEAQSLLVRSSLMAGNIDKAAIELAPLQKAYPQLAEVANLTALVAVSRKQTEAARAEYAKTLRSVPGSPEALAGLIRIDLATGRSKEAIELIENRLTAAKPPVAILLLAASTYAAVGDLKQSEALLLRAVEADPSRLQAYGLLAQLYISQHRLPEAEKRFRDILERTPKSVSAMTMLGLIMEQQGRTADAEKEYERVLAIDARAPVAANNLACIYLAANRKLDEALQLAQAAQQAYPNEPHINDTLGWIYYRKNMASSGLKHLELSAHDAPDDPAIQFHLGMVYVQTGDWPKARVALKRALQLKADFEGADEARKALATIGA